MLYTTSILLTADRKNAMLNANIAFLISMSMVALGYLLKRTGVIPEEHGHVLARLIFTITLPALILRTFMSTRIQGSLVILPLICLAHGALVLVFARLFFRGLPRRDRGLAIISSTGFNNGLFAFPIVEQIWGARGIQYLAMFDIGNVFLLMAVNYIIADLHSPGGGDLSVDLRYVLRSLVRSVPLMTYLVVLSINLTGAPVPAPFFNLVETVARANMPLALLLLGVYLRFQREGVRWKRVFSVLAVRYLFGMAVGIALFYALPYGLLLRRLLLIGLILPIGLVTIPYAVQFDFDRELAGTLTNLSNLISFALMWSIVAVLGGGPV
jgi:hypothetical protein